MYLKDMSKLKVKINCVDCNAERMITKACVSLVKRCKPCQKVFNREKARNRYRKLKGIPLDKPVTNVIKKKKKEKEVQESIKTEEVVEVKTPTNSLTEEELRIRRERISRLLDILPDASTIDDW